MRTGLAACAMLVSGIAIAGGESGGAQEAVQRAPREAVRGAQAAVRWVDLPEPIQRALASHGVREDGFDAWRTRVRETNAARLRDGDFDHLVHYALQSTRFTPQPPIEPALSAKAFVESRVARRIPSDARARLRTFAATLTGSSTDARLAHFRDIVGRGLRGAALDARLEREYVRAMRFLYEKEFVASRSTGSASAVAALYQSRGHSSDTEIEAGYGVYVALGTWQQLDPARRVQRVLIVGPGLDLAPRTGLIEEADPQSYQPFAVADALLQLGLSTRDGLEIDAVDLNPHVARTIARAVRTPGLRLAITSGIADDARTRMTEDYRAYLASFGRAIGSELPGPASRDGHIRKLIAIPPEIPRLIAASQLDIVTDRIRAGGGVDPGGSRGYDAVIITNVLPYLTNAELLVAIANIAGALAPGGALIHNEPRPLMLSAAASIGLPAIHARTLLLAKVPGGRDLYDTIWLHTMTAENR